MNIILVRHGDAGSATAQSKDAERSLSSAGEIKTRKNASIIKSFVPHLDYIVSSPLLRAQQTAKIFAEVYGYTKDIIYEKKLSSAGKSNDIIDLANYLDGKNIMFVGHQPDMSYFASDLISSSGATVEFKKSAAAKISFPKKAYPGKGVLEFLIPPSPEK